MKKNKQKPETSGKELLRGSSFLPAFALRRTWLMRGVLLLASLILIGAGIAVGEVGAVLENGIRVCLECVGVG